MLRRSRSEFIPRMSWRIMLTATPTILFAAMLGGQTSLPCLGAVSQPQGFSWTYSGTRRWSTGGDREKSERVTWTTTVVDTRTLPDATLALLRGFVTELAWSDPSSKPKLSVLVCSAGRLFHFDPSSDGEARVAFAHWDTSFLERAELLLETPLQSGRIFGQNPPRTDGMYGWTVETMSSPSSIPRSCGVVQGLGYHLAYRTMPDHQMIEWRSGIGVTGYVYEHHGTVAAADVRLVACRRTVP